MIRSKHGKRKWDKRLNHAINNGNSGYHYGYIDRGVIYTVKPFTIRLPHYISHYAV